MRVTTTGPPVLSEPLRTASGREVHDGDTVTPADPIVLPAVNGTSGTLTIGVAPAIPSADLSPNPRAMWWNNIRRAWGGPPPARGSPSAMRRRTRRPGWTPACAGEPRARR